jgi:hypothetical protein
MQPTVTVNDIARAPNGPAMLAKGHFAIKAAGRHFEVRTTTVKTPLGWSMWLLRCPACHRRCRNLHITKELKLLCAKCAHVRHPDQQTPGSKSGLILRRAQQLQRLAARLACRGLDRVTRRRLRRRKKRLLEQLTTALEQRQTRMGAHAQALLASLAVYRPEPTNAPLSASQKAIPLRLVGPLEPRVAEENADQVAAKSS